MATIPLKFDVPNIADVLEVFDRIKVYRAPAIAGEPGTPVEITSASTRIPLVTGQVRYDFVDNAGATTDFYATSYFNTGTLQESSLGPFSRVDSDPALQIISVEQLTQNYLFGVDLTDNDGNQFPDSMFEFYIRSAVGYVQSRLDLRLLPTVIENEKHDFIRQEYYEYVYFHTREYPILSVQSVKLVLPNEQEIVTFDPSFINLREEAGQGNIIPGNGTLSVIVLGQTGTWLPYLAGYGDMIPNVIRVSYTAGFEQGKAPPEILDLVGMIAAIGPLAVAGDLIVGAGIASQHIQVDNIMSRVETTQSAEFSGYSARILDYKRRAEQYFAELRRYYKGISMVVA